MRNYLDKAKKEKKLVSIYNDMQRADRFGVGYVAALNEEEVLLKSISPNGEYDGYMWLRMEDIFKFGTDGRYEKKILELYSLKAQREEELKISEEEQILDKLIAYAIAGKRVLEVMFLDEFFSGYPVEYNGETFVIRKVDEYGQENGMVCIQKSIVDEIHIDTITSRESEILRKKGGQIV